MFPSQRQHDLEKKKSCNCCQCLAFPLPKFQDPFKGRDDKHVYWKINVPSKHFVLEGVIFRANTFGSLSKRIIEGSGSWSECMASEESGLDLVPFHLKEQRQSLWRDECAEGSRWSVLQGQGQGDAKDTEGPAQPHCWIQTHKLSHRREKGKMQKRTWREIPFWNVHSQVWH